MYLTENGPDYNCPNCGELLEGGDYNEPYTCHICNIEHEYDICKEDFVYSENVKGDHIVFRKGGTRCYVGLSSKVFNLSDEELKKWCTDNNIPFIVEA